MQLHVRLGRPDCRFSVLLGRWRWLPNCSGRSRFVSKFMHLPVSVNGAFPINYLSSLLRLSLIVFVPIMLGFSVALVCDKGLLLSPRPAGAGGVPADGDGTHLSVSGLAGRADEQPAPASDGDRGHDHDLRTVSSIAEPDELVSRLGERTGKGTGRGCWWIS